MRYIVFASAAVFIAHMMDTSGNFLALLRFDPSLIMRGQIWRIVTWILFPIDFSPIFLAISLYFYYMIGTTLEREWGASKFTIYYIFGVLLHIIYGFITWFALGWTPFIIPSFLNLSMFFAFAVLFPDHRILLLFIIPVKIKWLALANAAFFVYTITVNLLAGRFMPALLPVIATLNFLLICGYDLLLLLRPIKARTSTKAIKFKKAARKVQREDSRPYRHKCAVCGKTDTDNPGLEFRYCSRCEGYHCFCIDHINNHVHFK